MNRLILVADNIRSTHNVGAFFRTCDAFGASLVLTGITPRPSGQPDDDRLPHIRQKMDDAIHKTALGAESTVTWEYFPSTDEAITHLRKSGYQVHAIEQAKSSKSISALSADQPTALIVGPEVDGISSDVLAQVDAIYEIPMQGEKESLNVSVAAGIALYAGRFQS